MLEECFMRAFWRFVLFVVGIIMVFIAYQIGRVSERRIAEPVIEALQIQNDCLSRVNNTYRLTLNDIGGGWCSGIKLKGVDNASIPTNS